MVNLQEWRRKRTITFRVFHMQCLMLGMEYSVTFLTLWLYLNTLVKTDDKKFFYTVISASYLLAGVLFSVVIGRWIDKTKNIRQAFLICNTLVIIGNCLYVLHYSPWLLVAGRMIGGAGGPLRSVISSEVARCFPANEVLKKFSSIGMAFAIGFIIGPGVNFLFQDVNFMIAGSLQITYANIPGVYMSVFFLFIQICVLKYVRNLSKEYDLKANETYEIENPILIEINNATMDHNINTKRKSCHSLGIIQSPNEASPLQKKRSRTFGSCQIAPSISPTIDNPTIICHNAHQETSINDSSQSLLNIQHHDDGTSRLRYDSRSYHSYRNSLAVIANLENSDLFQQTFTLSDSITSTSMLVILQNDNNANGENASNLPEENLISIARILREILHHFDVCFVFILTYATWFWMVCFDMWLPIMVVDVMEMGITELNGIMLGFGCISAIILLLLSFRTFSDQSLFKLSLCCMVALALIEIVFAAMKLYHENMYVNIVLWTIWGILFAIVVIMDEVFLIGVLAKMTSSKVQTFTESLRLALARLGALSALLSSVYLFQWMEYVCAAGIGFAIIVFIILITRRKTFKNPKVLIE